MKSLAGVRRALLPLALATGCALPAAAQSFSMHSSHIADALRRAGYTATVHAEDSPAWVAGYSPTLKANIEVRFDGCDEEGDYCTVASLLAGFNFSPNGKVTPLEKINEWNTNYFGKAYVYNNTMYVTTDMHVDGATKEGFDATLEWYGTIVRDFIGFIGWKAN